MATTLLLQHLENIKIFSDFKKSHITSFDEFWERIEKGQSIIDIQSEPRNVPNLNLPDPTDEELNEIEAHREWLRRKPLDELYVSRIRNRLEDIVDQDTRSILNLFELTDLKDIINGNEFLKEYLEVTKETIHQYVDQCDIDNPERFFKEYTGMSNTSNNAGTARSNDKEIFSETDNEKHSEFFKENGYRLFKSLTEQLPGSASDHAYIFGKLRENSFVHYSISESNFRRFLESQGFEDFKRLKPLHTVTTKSREVIYNRLKENLGL